MIKGSGIYSILNLITGKLYIGSAARLYYRLANHKHLLKCDKHKNKYLQSAWNKYGEDAFEFRILEIVEDKLKLAEREQHWMDLTKCCIREHGYNLYPTARSPLGFKHSIETRIKVSQGLKNRVRTEETKRKISESNKGRVISDISRVKMSLAKRGDKSHKRNKLKYPCNDGVKCMCDDCRKTKRERNRLYQIEYRQKIDNMKKIC